MKERYVKKEKEVEPSVLKSIIPTKEVKPNKIRETRESVGPEQEGLSQYLDRMKELLLSDEWRSVVRFGGMYFNFISRYGFWRKGINRTIEKLAVPPETPVPTGTLDTEQILSFMGEVTRYHSDKVLSYTAYRIVKREHLLMTKHLHDKPRKTLDGIMKYQERLNPEDIPLNLTFSCSSSIGSWKVFERIYSVSGLLGTPHNVLFGRHGRTPWKERKLSESISGSHKSVGGSSLDHNIPKYSVVRTTDDKWYVNIPGAKDYFVGYDSGPYLSIKTADQIHVDKVYSIRG